MATQIKVIREQRGNMTQAALAEKAGMKQSRISALENVNYQGWSINTLRRVARALGVRVAFKFESWGELLPEIENFGRKALELPRFEDDIAFQPSVAEDAANTAVGASRSPKDANKSKQIDLEVLQGRKPLYGNQSNSTSPQHSPSAYRRVGSVR